MRIYIAVRVTLFIAVQGRFYLLPGRDRDFSLRRFSWYDKGSDAIPTLHFRGIEREERIGIYSQVWKATWRG